MSDYCKCDPRYLADCAYCDGCEYGGETKEKSLSMGNRIQVMIVAQRLYSGVQAATVSLRRILWPLALRFTISLVTVAVRSRHGRISPPGPEPDRSRPIRR